MTRTASVAIRIVCGGLAMACVAAIAIAQTGAPAALEQAVVATTRAKSDYAFDMENTSAKQNWRAHYDPGASPRLRLIEPARLEGDAQTAFNRMAENAEGVRWCASEDMTHAQNMRLLREDESSATYAFTPSAEMMRGPRGASAQNAPRMRAMGERIQGEFTITKQNPDITQMRVFTTGAFSPIPLVRLEQMNFTIRCAVAPNGRRYAAETAVEVRGSAFGRRFDQNSLQRTSNLRAP